MTDEIQVKAENCRLAMKAAMEAIQDYCGMGVAEHTIEFAGATIKYPEEVYQIAIDETIEDDDCIEKIAASGWTVNQAKALCLSMFDGENEAREAKACVGKLVVALAERVVKPIRT